MIEEALQLEQPLVADFEFGLKYPEFVPTPSPRKERMPARHAVRTAD